VTAPSHADEARLAALVRARRSSAGVGRRKEEHAAILDWIRTLVFPNHDGNGMYVATGNVVLNQHVGILFIDFERGRRLRFEGTASIDLDDPLQGDYPEAQFVVRVRARAVYPNCPRYIHRYELVRRTLRATQRSPYPGAGVEAFRLGGRYAPAHDPARDPGVRDALGDEIDRPGQPHSHGPRLRK
jgi:hypothetical protein